MANPKKAKKERKSPIGRRSKDPNTATKRFNRTRDGKTPVPNPSYNSNDPSVKKVEAYIDEATEQNPQYLRRFQNSVNRVYAQSTNLDGKTEGDTNAGELIFDHMVEYLTKEIWGYDTDKATEAGKAERERNVREALKVDKGSLIDKFEEGPTTASEIMAEFTGPATKGLGQRLSENTALSYLTPDIVNDDVRTYLERRGKSAGMDYISTDKMTTHRDIIAHIDAVMAQEAQRDNVREGLGY